MLESRFFELPRDNEDLARTIRGIKVFGGGDEPEDGLEALAYAMESEWNTDGVRNGGMKNRQIIVMWTDASAHELGFGAKSPYYPKNMPKNFMDLTDMWYNEQMECMSFQSKRLLLYAPEHTSGWDEIAREWDNVIYYPSNAGEGLQETSYDLIIAQIANSVG